MEQREVYITGLSCRFPESDSASEFFQNLLNKRDMVSADSRRWDSSMEDVPSRFGQIKQDLSLFDHKFFSVHGKQAEKLDPQLRLLLEVSYEGLVDAGLALNDLKGSQAGVYIGACGSDAHTAWMQDRDSLSGYEHTGCATSMLANRLSFTYDLHGPSETIDTACSSSLVAFHRAVSDLRAGVCDYAIVGGTSLIFWSTVTAVFNKLKMLSPDGACKAFDQAANGFARAEGVGILILTTQKQHVYRPYAKVLATGVNNGGWNASGITVPNGALQKELYLDVCDQAGIEPKSIDYVEAHGTGTVVGDGEELEALFDVYGKENPQLFIGSVKSNMGHCEGASGMAGLIKTLLCFEQETLAPNLHLKNPNPKLKTMRVATDALASWKAKRAAVNSFGFGGTNAHVIVEKCAESFQKQKKADDFHLTLLAGRTKEGVLELKRSLSKGLSDVRIPDAEVKQKLPFREVLELPDDAEVANVSDREDKIYLACSGNGSQWKGMGVGLSRVFPAFASAVNRCSKAVGCDLQAIFISGFQDALQATLSLTALQIGLVELLKTFGIQKEQVGGFLGHSAGEIVCSYLDGLTTVEETMQIAYARGFSANQTGDGGLMASVGLSVESAQKAIDECACADKVSIACLNSPNNVTISGHKENVLQVVEKLSQKEIFTRVLETCSKAYHSPLFTKHRPALEALLETKMKGIQADRSGKWYSTVAGLDHTGFDFLYHVEGVLRQVDFMGAVRKIPQNAIVLELGPHHVLRTLIRESRPDLKYVSLMKQQTDELQTLKEGLGKLWKVGFNLKMPHHGQDLSRLPLDIRTKVVSWDHSEKFSIPKQEDFEGAARSSSKVTYNLSSEKESYLKGHVVDGKTLLPATSYLCAMWETFRKNQRLQLKDSVHYNFSDFEIIQAIQVEDQSSVELLVSHFDHQYELRFKEELIARVKIETASPKPWNVPAPVIGPEDRWIDTANFYRIVAGAGYQYTGQFQVIRRLKSDFENNRNYCLLNCSNDNWITLLDGVLQCQLLPPKEHLEELRVPVRIRSFAINPHLFYEAVKSSDTVLAISDFDTQSVTLPGIDVSGLETKELVRQGAKRQNEVEIQQASSLVYLGENLIKDETFTKYSDFVANYSTQLCRELIEKKGVSQQGHYKRILDILERRPSYRPVTQEEIAHYRAGPENIFVRVLDHCYVEHSEEFFKTPLIAITQHPEYGSLYFKDPIASLHPKEALGKLFSIVKDNANLDQLNILEIGSGTGGLTRLIAPYIFNDQYIATDITENSQLGKIERLNLRYEKFHLDDLPSFDIFSKQNVDLVLASNSLHTGLNVETILSTLHANLKEGAFVLFYELTSIFALPLFGMDHRLWSFEDEREYGLWISVDSWKRKLKQAGFEIVSYFTTSDEVGTLFLVRKPKALKLAQLQAPSIDGFDSWYNKILQCDRPTLLVSKDLLHGGVVSFARSLNREFDSAHFYTLFCQQEVDQALIEEVERYGLRFNVVEEGRLATIAYSDIEAQATEPVSGYSVRFPVIGDFSKYEWHANPLSKEGNYYKTKFAALNFKDIMLVGGKISKDAFGKLCESVGVEFSGVDSKGKKYMGLNRGISTRVAPIADWMIPVPEAMSLEDAATIPVVYGTVYYALFERAHIQPGQTVLIHAAAGGVGQAAIHVCLSLKCKIFVTCHQSKKKIVRELFPELDEDSIFDSRTADFERQVMKRTKGEGVHIVVNSLADDKLQASIRCLRGGGHFLEIGKYDMMKHSPIDMNILIKNTTIHGVDLEHRFLSAPHPELIFKQVAEGIKQGVVKPLPRHVFHHSQIDEAFRFMAAGKHIGKVLIDMEHLDSKTSHAPFKYPFHHNPKEEGYYLVTGGLGGFGLALLKWLSQRGVKKFIVTSRTGISSAEQQRMIRLLQSKGAEIIVSTANVADERQVQELIESVQGKISAVYHLAMVLEDGLFKNMTREKWEKVVHIKAKGAIHLDRLTRLPSVKQFVVFSSLASRQGNIGQSNYGFGNGVMEETCRLRRKEGYHALAIQWGGIDNVGFVANNLGAFDQFAREYVLVSIQDALAFLDRAVGYQLNTHCINYTGYELQRTTSEVVSLSAAEVFQQICNVVKTDLGKCNATDTLEYLGIDSLQVVEIQTILIKTLKEVLPLKKISVMKVAELRELIESKLSKEKDLYEPSAAKMAAKSENLLSNVHRVKADKIVYLFPGFGVNPQSLQFPKTDRFDLSLVYWHNAQSISQLASAIEADLKSQGYKEVVFATHSAGYQIARALMSQGGLKVDRLVAVSLLNEETVHSLVSIDKIEEISPAVWEENYKKAAFFVEDHLPIQQIQQQAVLLSKAVKAKIIPPHLVLYPKDDPICIKAEGAISIRGTHRIDSFDLQEIYGHL